MSAASSETAVDNALKPLHDAQFLSLLNPYAWCLGAFRLLYELYQRLLRFLFMAPYSPVNETNRFGRVAIIGAGLTGVSSAAHCVSHGFEVVIYEEGSEVGGIWVTENKTSALQLHSALYRFHPAIIWSRSFPSRDEILGEVKRIWHLYHLEDSTRFNTRVDKITRHSLSTDPHDGGHARWVINDGQDGIFDAVIATVGTCGRPCIIQLAGQESFKGKVVHSSQLDSLSDDDIRGKTVVVIGSGASGVESAEFAVNMKASHTSLLARSDKWIIPRATLFDIMLSLQPFGRQMPLSFIPEWLVRTFHYRNLKDLSPAKTGLFVRTPIVNDAFLQHIREKKVSYVRGSTKAINPAVIIYHEHDRHGNANGEGSIQADLIILATGYRKPSLDFLPQDLFPVYEPGRRYDPPNLYLQGFSTADWSVLLTNSAYKDAIGTVGNWHIGIYSRVLMVFLLDEQTRPKPAAMKLWVDIITYTKSRAFKDKVGLNFFTYAELCIFFALFFLPRVSRWRYLPFVLAGWGVRPNPADAKTT